MIRLKATLQVLALSPALLLLGTSVPALAQQQTPQTQQEPQTTPKSSKATSQTKADRDMTAKIRKALKEDTSLSKAAQKVSVRTRDGKVTLSGTVPTEQDKDEVIAKAKDIAGASNVMDHIKVSSSKAKKGE